MQIALDFYVPVTFENLFNKIVITLQPDIRERLILTSIVNIQRWADKFPAVDKRGRPCLNEYRGNAVPLSRGTTCTSRKSSIPDLTCLRPILLVFHSSYPPLAELRLSPLFGGISGIKLKLKDEPWQHGSTCPFSYLPRLYIVLDLLLPSFFHEIVKINSEPRGRSTCHNRGLTRYRSHMSRRLHYAHNILSYSTYFYAGLNFLVIRLLYSIKSIFFIAVRLIVKPISLSSYITKFLYLHFALFLKNCTYYYTFLTNNYRLPNQYISFFTFVLLILL
jgi:hypothetical protein